MSPAEVFAAIAKGTEVATALASALGLDREYVIRVAANQIRPLHPEPPDQAGDWEKLRAQLLGDKDELERHPKTDPAPPPGDDR